MTEPRFLTLSEASIRFRKSTTALQRLLRQGVIAGFKVPGRGGYGEWRILDPGDKFDDYLKAIEQPVISVPIITSREAAAILGISHNNLRQLVFHGKLKPAGSRNSGHINLFTVQELRDYLWRKEKRSRGGRQVALRQIIKWARALIDQDLEGTAAPIAAADELADELEKIMELPNPARSESLKDFWRKLDLASHLVEAVREKSACPSPQISDQ